MPLYDYDGCICGRREHFQRMADEPLTQCPDCGQPIEKVITAPNFTFKKTAALSTDEVARQYYGEKLGRKVEKDEVFYPVPASGELVPVKGLNDRQQREQIAEAHQRAGDTDVAPDKVILRN